MYLIAQVQWKNPKYYALHNIAWIPFSNGQGTLTSSFPQSRHWTQFGSPATSDWAIWLVTMLKVTSHFITTCYLLLATCYLLIATYHLLLVTCYSQLVTRYLVLVTCYLLLVTCNLLVATYYLVSKLEICTWHNSVPAGVLLRRWWRQTGRHDVVVKIHFLCSDLVDLPFMFF